MKRFFVLLQQLMVSKVLPGGLLFLLSLTACMPASTPPVPPPLPPPDMSKTLPVPRVRLELGSWRMEDLAQMRRILSRFNEKYPHITIDYETYDTSDMAVYTPVLEAMLKQGKAPDIFYLPSYSYSQKLYDAGYLEPLNDLSGLTENFSPEALSPWQTEDGVSYGVPFTAVSHGIYYNINIFKRYHLSIPKTWPEFLQTADTLQKEGITPLANASGENWPMAELVFMSLVPNFIGGQEGRLAYLNGDRCFNDEHIIDTFQAVKDISAFFPKNQKYLKYSDSLQLFLQGKTAMWLSASWDIPFLEEQSPNFEWGVFAVPPLAGQPGYITFHPDAGIGVNTASSHKQEALLFLEWMTTSEFAELLANELPGFFSLNKNMIFPDDLHAREFLDLSSGREKDVRFAWQKISSGTPDAYSLIGEETVAVSNGELTPQQAANDLQTGLSIWYQPAQTCDRQMQ